MKILLTATVQSHICQFHRPLVEVLHSMGCEVHVAAKDNLSEKNGLELNFADRVFDVPFARSPKSPSNIKAYRQLKKIIQTEHYDIIHCNTPMGGVVTRLAARKARKEGTIVIYTAHGFHFYQGAPKKNWIVFFPIEKWFSRLTDILITITREDYNLARHRFHCKVARIHGVGVDESRYCPVSAEERGQLRMELGFDEKQPVLLCVGELLPNKNQKMAVHAMQSVVKEFPDARLLLAGNGPEEENLKKEISDCGLRENVQMIGYCTCLEKYQRVADVLVACSRREGLPLNLVEAMLSGNPVVASGNRGHRELVQTGKTGYLVPADDYEAMGQFVIKLLKDNTLREEMGENAEEIAKKYSASHVKEELGEIYSSLACTDTDYCAVS